MGSNLGSSACFFFPSECLVRSIFPVGLHSQTTGSKIKLLRVSRRQQRNVKSGEEALVSVRLQRSHIHTADPDDAHCTDDKTEAPGRDILGTRTRVYFRCWSAYIFPHHVSTHV